MWDHKLWLKIKEQGIESQNAELLKKYKNQS